MSTCLLWKSARFCLCGNLGKISFTLLRHIWNVLMVWLSPAPHSYFHVWASRKTPKVKWKWLRFCRGKEEQSSLWNILKLLKDKLLVTSYNCVIAEWSKINKRSPVPEISSTIIFISVMTPEGFVEGKHGVFPHTSQCHKDYRNLAYFAICCDQRTSHHSHHERLHSKMKQTLQNTPYWHGFCLWAAVEQLEPLWNSSEKLSKIDVDFWLMLMHNIELFWISLAYLSIS